MTNDAKKGAQKICGQGTCHYAYRCGHANKAAYSFPLAYAKETDECPLAKYDIEPDPRPWYERSYEETHAGPNEFSSLCRECRWRIEPDDDRQMIGSSTNISKCIDCPVFGAYEAYTEQLAESLANMY